MDPATFRFVAQCLNYCATACPVRKYKFNFKSGNIRCPVIDGIELGPCNAAARPDLSLSTNCKVKDQQLSEI
jgi:hypothetical protein